jgi:ATP synthase A1 C subunit
MIEIVVILLASIGLLSFVMLFVTRKTTELVYCNATVGAWEAKLLSEARLMELADLPNTQNIFSALSETEYKPQLEGVGKENPELIEVERALHEHVVKKFRELLELIPNERRGTMKKLLQRTDLFNMKAIIAMIHQKVPREQRMKELIPSITPRERFELLASAEDLKEFLEFLKGSEYFDVVSEVLPNYETYGLAPLFTALDKHYYSSLWKDVISKKSQRSVLKAVAGTLIDSANAKIILRLKQGGVPPLEIDKFIIRPSHELTEPMLKAMVTAEDIPNAIHMIHITSVGKVLKEASEKIEKEGVQAAEKSLDEFYLKFCRWLEISQFFSLAPVISYIAQKENEARNLRMIIRLNADGVSAQEIKEGLVRVPKIEL